MLRALCKELNLEFLSGSTPQNPKDLTWICPNCDRELSHVRPHLRVGFPIVEHFRHASMCLYAQTEAESDEHLYMKLDLKKRFEATNRMRFIKTEYKIEDRIADIGMVLNDGHKVVVECQKSGISIDEFWSRTDIYNKNGFSVFWVFWRNPIDVELFVEMRVPAIELVVRSLYFNRVFYYFPDQGVYVIRYYPVTREFEVPSYIAEQYRIDDSYQRTLKTYKVAGKMRDVTSYTLNFFENKSKKLSSVYHESFKKRLSI